VKNIRTIRTIVFNSLLVCVFTLSFFNSPSAFARTPIADVVDVERNQESEPNQSTPLPVDGVSLSEGDRAVEQQEFVKPEPLEANDSSQIDTGARESDSLPETAVVEAHQITAITDIHMGGESIQTQGSIDAWQNIMSEGFEGNFPSDGWTVFDDDGSTNGEYYWDDDDYKPFSGLWSGWPANGGADGLDPEFNYYPNNMISFMIYGPFDLSDAIDAELLFSYWNQTELNFDYFGWYASTDGSNFHGYSTSGDSGGWLFENFDLTSVPALGDVTGDSSVWIAFVFTSDGSVVDDGAFVDDIVLDKYVPDTQPNLVPYTPSGWDYPIVPSSVTGTNTLNDLYADLDTYIDWTVANVGGADISQTFYTCLYYDGSEIQCWYTNGLSQGYYTWVEDWILNLTPTQGWHTLKIVTDVYNDVAESNESDNEWQNDFYWDGPAADCDAVLAAFDEHYKGTSIRSANDESPVLMPPHPDLLDRARKGEVTLPDLITNPTLRHDRGIDQPADLPVPPQGLWNALAILVEFTDNPSQVGATDFDSLLFGSGFSTLPDYFNEVSYGILDIVTVNLPSSIGWCTMPETYAYYVAGNNGFGIYPQNAQRMAEDAVWIADPYIDFSNYDNDGDGWVDTVFIVHAGPGAEATGDPNDIWSHSWETFNDPFVDGVTVNGYTTEPEFWYSPGDMTIGVYAHELGHAFGLPDLYDTDDSSEGVGNWSLMGGGSWNGTNGDSPAFMDAWSRAELEFLTPVNVTSNMTGASIPQAETSQTVYRMWTDGVVGSEYFLIENRQQTGYDAALPSEGLLIWHIDENKLGNNLECDQLNNWLCGDNHFLVALEQADGLWDLEHFSNRGDAGDPYPGNSNNRAFTFATVPNSSSYYSSADTEIGVTNISNSSSTMTADLAVSTVNSFSLTVSKDGTGSGTVTSSPPGIDCDTDCDESYLEGTTVTLTALADPGSTFTGWGGDCSGTGSCVVTMNSAKSVTATFTAGDGATLWIEPPEATLWVSSNFTVDVMVTDVTDLYGAELELIFDPTFVEVVDYDTGTAGIQIQPGDCPSPDFVVSNSANNTTGTISYAATSLSPSPPCDGGGVIASITFHGLSVGNTLIHISSYILSDTNLNAVPVSSVLDGRLYVDPPQGILEGTVDVQGRADESSAEVCVWQGGAELGCTTTDAAGYYSFSLPANTYDVFLEMERYLDGEKPGQVVIAGGTTTLCQVKVLGGDANDDDVINILDLSFMGFRFGQSIGDPNWDERADINNDGTINILDIVGAGANFNETSPVPWPCP
jgi:immune inhibitor A